MSSKAHNKKRNIGLLYEFMVRAASTALIEGDSAKSERILKILRHHLRPGSALHREFRLFNSLMKVKISSESVAGTILREAREAARSYDVEEVSKQKTRLINEINRTLDDPSFWDVPVPNYRVYATVGTLISEWREQSGKVDLQKLAEYEQQLVEWLMSEKPTQPQLSESPRDGTQKLAFKLALKKFNDKYSQSLLPVQKEIIRQWALSKQNDRPEVISRALGEVKQATLSDIASALAEERLQPIASELVKVRDRLISENLDRVDDDTVKRFMLYAKLRAEINSAEDGEKSE